MIIYSKNSGFNDAAIGRISTPIKMLIEHESDLLTKKIALVLDEHLDGSADAAYRRVVET